MFVQFIVCSFFFRGAATAFSNIIYFSHFFPLFDDASLVACVCVCVQVSVGVDGGVHCV